MGAGRGRSTTWGRPSTTCRHWPPITRWTPSGRWSSGIRPAGPWRCGRPVEQGTVRPRGHVSLAGVTDLAACSQDDLLGGACSRLLGGSPTDVGGRYRLASPIEGLPTGRRLALVHGADDDIVPVGQSEAYASAAEQAGDRVTLVTVPDAGHFQLIDVDHPAYAEVLTQIDRLLA